MERDSESIEVCIEKREPWKKKERMVYQLTDCVKIKTGSRSGGRTQTNVPT